MRNQGRSLRFTEKDLQKRGSSSAGPSRMAAKDYVKKASKSNVESETKIQQSLIRYIKESGLTWKGRPLIEYIYAIPNGGYRAITTARVLVAEGVKKGVPDLHCFIAREPYHSLYIEMKNDKGSLSEDQKHVIPILRSEGHKVVVCRSKGQALAEIFKYLGWNE